MLIDERTSHIHSVVCEAGKQAFPVFALAIEKCGFVCVSPSVVRNIHLTRCVF